jgi:hypothetical protein
VRLFRALLAADVDLASKAGDDGKLLLVVFHTGDKDRATTLVTALAGIRRMGLTRSAISRCGSKTPRSTPRSPSTKESHQRGSSSRRRRPPRTIATIVRYGIVDPPHVVVYSPFEGHVEQGVLGGLSVEAQVRPYVNTRHARAPRTSTLKSFFMKVTKVYRMSAESGPSRAPSAS